MRTFGRHESGSSAGKYPARCDLCGVVYQAKELRRGPDGMFRCPSDRDERSQMELDRANTRNRSRGVVDSRKPGDPPVADETYT